MEEINFNNGCPLSLESNKKNWPQMAKDFSEGNKYLEKFLLTAWNKGIKTFACCNGHLNELFSYGYNNYIAFYADTDEEALNLATNLFCVLHRNPTIKLTLGKLFLSTDTPQQERDTFIGLNPINNTRRSVDVFLNINNYPLKSYYYKLLTNTINKIDVLKPQNTPEFKKYFQAIKNMTNNSTFSKDKSIFRHDTYVDDIPLTTKKIAKHTENTQTL